MPFRTQLDYSSNRQIKQHPETFTTLSGGTLFGLTFSALTSGPNLLTSGVTESLFNLISTFSGNNTTTVYTWSEPIMALGESGLSAFTSSNSGITQNTGNIFSNSIISRVGTASPFVILAGTVITNGLGGSRLVTGSTGHISTESAPFTNVNGSDISGNGALNGGVNPPSFTSGTPLGDAHESLLALTALTPTFSYSAGAIDLATDVTTPSGVGVFTPGIYKISGAASVGAAGIILSGAGEFVFQITGALTTVVGSIVTLSGGAASADVYWVPVGGASLGATSSFVGNILSGPAAITTGADVDIDGRLISESAITLGGGTPLISIPPNSPMTIIDGNMVVLTYGGISFDVTVLGMISLGGGNYSGSVLTTRLDIFSANTLDFTGRTIWVDVRGITRTEDLIITDNPTVGYVWTCIDSEGRGSWSLGSSSGTSSSIQITGGTPNNTAHTYTFTNSTGGTFTVAGLTDITVTGATYNSTGGTATFTNTTGGTFSITGFSTGDTYWISGSTGTFSLKAKNNSGLDATGNYALAEGNATTAAGANSHAEGNLTIASGLTSHAEGLLTIASGVVSHAEGSQTTASGAESHAEGNITTASNQGCHAEGGSTKAIGVYSHAEGFVTTASGIESHAEGNNTKAIGNHSHAQGSGTTASGSYSHAEGNLTIASGLTSHSEGYQTTAVGDYSHAEGGSTKAIGSNSHSEGNSTTAVGSFSHAEGNFTRAIGNGSHAEGNTTTASGSSSHAEGNFTSAIGSASHSEGNTTLAFGDNSHVEGIFTTAVGDDSHAEGNSTTAVGLRSHAEGNGSKTFGFAAHAEGSSTTAVGIGSHSEGGSTTAVGNQSHAEGSATIAIGVAAHAEGSSTTAVGDNSHAEGSTTTAVGTSSHAEGNAAIAVGITSHAEGQSTTAVGLRSHAGGNTSIASGTTSFIHSTNSIVTGNRSVLLGGQNLTGATDDYVYVPSLNINVVGSSAFVNDIRIDANGNLTTNTSDLRLKENIHNIIGALETIKQLRGVSYQWKDRNAGGDDIRLGFIAQEVEKVQPLLTFTNKNDDYKGIHIDAIIPLLVEAIKELSSTSALTTNGSVYLETQTIIAEDNNIELNYSGNVQTAIGGGITVLHAMGSDKSAELKTDANGNWVTNNGFKAKNLSIPIYTPTSSNDEIGNHGNVTIDDNYLYIKSSDNKWKRIKLENF